MQREGEGDEHEEGEDAEQGEDDAGEDGGGGDDDDDLGKVEDDAGEEEDEGDVQDVRINYHEPQIPEILKWEKSWDFSKSYAAWWRK